MIKEVSVLGLGKLGCSMAAVFAEKGFDVTGFDLDAKKVDAVNQGRAPVYEFGLADLIKKNHSRLKATHNVAEAVAKSDITFMVVPTPSRADGRFETKYAIKAAEDIGAALKKKSGYHVVVLTSTVLPGDSRAKIIPALERTSGKKCGNDFGFCYSPEFIALGSVIHDLVSPDYFLIGQFDQKSGDALVAVNRQVAQKDPSFSRITIEEAELAKIATNAYITMKVSYANMLEQICDRLPNAVVDNVTQAIGMDSRIGRKYLSGGLSFGGPCFPRDNVALARFAEGLGIDAMIPPVVDRFNNEHSRYVAQREIELASKDARIGLVGLSYKPGSHVLQDSASIAIYDALRARGQRVKAYDPLQSEFERGSLPVSVTLVNSLDELAAQSDVLVLTHRDELISNAALSLLQKRGIAPFT